MCTNYDWDTTWCATSVDSKGNYEDWGDCSDVCPSAENKSEKNNKKGNGGKNKEKDKYQTWDNESEKEDKKDKPPKNEKEKNSGKKDNDTDEVCKCQFPFTYKNTTYNECTELSHNQPWCATKVNDKGEYAGGWGNCRAICPAKINEKDSKPPKNEKEKNSGKKDDTVEACKCQFPFTY